MDSLTRAALRFKVVPIGDQSICYWAVYCTKNEKPFLISGNFDTAEKKNKTQISKHVIFSALEKLNQGNHSNVHMYVAQHPMRKYFSEILDLVPSIKLLELEDEGGAALNHIAADWVSKLKKEGEREALVNTFTAERTVYVNTDDNPNRALAGYGYVIKDETKDETLRLVFGSRVIGKDLYSGNVGMELNAILDVLSKNSVIPEEALEGKRTLTVVSGSDKSVDILNALLDGREPILDAAIKHPCLYIARQILEAVKWVNGVSFQKVDGSAVTLSEASNLLALSARKGREMELSRRERLDMGRKIADATIDGLSRQGIKALAEDIRVPLGK